MTCNRPFGCADNKKDLNILKSAIFALLLAGSAIGTVSTAALAAERPLSSYTLSCVLRSGCVFVCHALSASNREVIFQKKNVREINFAEYGSAATATLSVANERPTVVRLGGAIFCEMSNALVQHFGKSLP